LDTPQSIAERKWRKLSACSVEPQLDATAGPQFEATPSVNRSSKAERQPRDFWRALRAWLSDSTKAGAQSSEKSAAAPSTGTLATLSIQSRGCEPSKRLDPDQSARVWRFTELLTKAEEVLGTRQRAVEWMLEPAMALEKRRPIELLTTPVGAQLAEDVIERMRYGVYQGTLSPVSTDESPIAHQLGDLPQTDPSTALLEHALNSRNCLICRKIPN
jgi:putative toxin-antitoxin system antitoxin component (TIGR02293 family)